MSKRLVDLNVDNDKKDRYSIVWKPFPPSEGLVKATGATVALPIPLFLTGEDLEIFESYGGFPFYPFNVLRGILVGLQDNPPTIDIPSIKPFLLKVLFLLKEEFQADTIEELVLSCSAHIREYQGLEPCASALRTGCQVCPESSKIASDLVVTLWNITELYQIEEPHLLKDIATLGITIDLGQVDTKITPYLVYVVAVALFYTNDPRISQYYTDVVIKNLSNRGMLQKIDRLRNGHQFKMSEMKLG
jgi:hypothetical protein